MDKNNRAFTLIELLITTTIMALFFGMTLANHNNFAEEKRTSAETQKFSDTLELARKKAFTSDQSNPCGEFIGYSVVVNTNAYELRSRCTLGSTLIHTYRFSNSFQSTTPQTISFDSLTGKSSNSCVVIKNTSTNQCFNVQVTQAGSITSNKCNSCGVCC